MNAFALTASHTSIPTKLVIQQTSSCRSNVKDTVSNVNYHYNRVKVSLTQTANRTLTRLLRFSAPSSASPLSSSDLQTPLSPSLQALQLLRIHEHTTLVRPRTNKGVLSCARRDKKGLYIKLSLPSYLVPNAVLKPYKHSSEHFV